MEQAIIDAVKAHAKANYDKGWDTVVECYDDADIARTCKGARTAKGAIKKMAEDVRIYNEYAADICGA